MKLKSLEMIGFKSFVDRIQLRFPEGITSIVGPNGCGKSNIVDAILWAIGERSAKHLRGKLMEDVIFGGTDGRKPVGMAEVNLTFQNGVSAPSTLEPYGEITITRRLYRSGESEYLINKVPCRLRDITDLFLDSGLGVNGYSVVEQGRVEYLIKANPQDRRFLIEEAAGIAKYKERKRLALMKMEATQQNLLRIQDIIAEVKRQILTLERQVKRAEEYKAIRKEVKEIELRLAMQEYAELSEKGDGARGYLQALRERETGISSQSSQKEALIEEMRLHGMEEEEKLRALQENVFELGRKIQKLESEAEFLRREDENLQKQEGQALFEVRENLGAWRQANRDHRQLVQGQETLEEERRLSEEGLKAQESCFNDVKVNYQSFLETSEEEKGRLIDTLTHLTSLKNRLSHLDERREDLQKRIRSNEDEVKKVSSKEAVLEESLRTSTREKETLLLVRSMLQEEKVGWEGELDALREVFKQRQTERREKEDALRQDRSRYLSLKELQENFEGYEKGVKSILLQKKETAEKWNGILGTVADILEPEPQYEVPLEAVLGQRLQYLIAENNRDAVEAINYLKSGSLGRGSFLPREVHRREERSSGQRSLFSEHKEEEKPRPLMGFVNVKEGYGPLAEFLIGDVGVVQRSEDAFRLIQGNGHFNTFVTLDGDVIEKTGIVSGGSLDQGLSLLERRRVIRQLEGMIKEKDGACQSLHEEERCRMEEIEEREGRLERRKQEIQDKELELIHKERDLEQLARDMDQCKGEMEVLQFEKSQLEEEAREVEREKEEVSLKMGTGETMKQQGEEQVQSLKRKVEDLREEADRLGAEITERKVFLASLEEKQRGMEAQRINLSNGQKTLKEQILRRIEAIRKGRDERTSLAARSAQSRKELEQSLVDYRQHEESLTGQKEKVEVFLNELKEAEASAKYLRQELDSVRQKIHEEEIRASEIQLKLQHLQESMRERYGTTLSASIGSLSEEFPREEKLKRLEELKKALEGFGEVNLMALEEYQELKQRHDFLTEQQTDLQQALDALKKAILRINRTTTKRFLETFHLVNERFKEVFVRLFKGGQASLILLDEQDPSTTGIDIIAQPPGKKLQNIDLLSGGEKALVAIALIFGLFMIRPTPFCLLDEIDAPLDDANINRFIELVKDFSKTSQFVFITHNKKTMETADTLYGITMETPGVSKAVSVRLTET